MEEEKEATVRIYRATNVITGICVHVPATKAQDVVDSLGWQLGETFIIVLEPTHHHSTGEADKLRVKVPCRVCPFQYAQCTIPKAETCPVQSQAPELSEWLKQVTQAHLCSHVGHSLDKKDHELHQVWLGTESAIALLTSER